MNGGRSKMTEQIGFGKRPHAVGPVAISVKNHIPPAFAAHRSEPAGAGLWLNKAVCNDPAGGHLWNELDGYESSKIV